jgi:DNA-binding transcriptional MerR regulator
MRIAELSRTSGTSIPTIKYYLREGLLPAGTATNRNQAEYGEAHRHRLRLIRALIDVGGLSVAAAREVLAAVDAPDLPSHFLLGAAHGSLVRPRRRDPADESWRAARDEVVALVQRRGWYVDLDCADVLHAADAVAAFRSLGQEDLLETMDTYADAAEMVAAREVETVIARREPARMVEGVVTGTILGEAILNAFRRMAQQDASARRLVDPEDLRSAYAAEHG